MQVPIRKPGKFTHTKPDLFMTQEKLNELTKNLEKLKNKIPKERDEVQRLGAMGDFSENAAYQIAKGRLRGLNSAIEKIEYSIKHAKLIQEPQQNDCVRIGSTVTIQNDQGLLKFKILGSSESDPAKGVISHLSALGSTLLGKKLDEPVKLNLNEKTFFYTIIKIE